MKLFTKEEVNTGRQFEFDFAKAVCILGMVLIHCLEEFVLNEEAYFGDLYYVFIVVLNSIFGAGTFMICLGAGLSYTKKNTSKDFIKRGLIILLIGFVLNIIRFVIPAIIFPISDDQQEVISYIIDCFLYTDILQFAGLAFLLFGFLKMIKLPDWAIGLVALVMSIVGSFARFIELNEVWYSEVTGLFIGTTCTNWYYPYIAPFPLINWFIIVVIGYYLGKLIKRCTNMELFYAISTPVSAVVVTIYMLIAIPNRLGMMCGDEIYYFQMTTLDTLIILCGALVMFGIYHYISKLFSEKVKNFITGLSVNINKTYCIHWIIVGWTSFAAYALYDGSFETYVVLLIGFAVYIVSSVLAEVIRRVQLKKKEKKNESSSEQ